MSTIKVAADELTPLEISFDDPVYLGQSIEMDFQLLDKPIDEGGVPQDLTSTRWVFFLLVTKGTTPAITKDSGAQPTSTFPIVGDTAELRLTPSDTHPLAALKYTFQIWLEMAGGRRFMFATGIVTFVKPIAEIP